MNSQIKDALSEFINSNSSAIEKAMENESHDLTKGEPTIPDLVNYLSCPTPQPVQKDAQPMSLEDKPSVHNPTFNHSEVQAGTQQGQFDSSQMHAAPETAQYNNAHMCTPSTETSYNTGAPHDPIPPDSHPNQQQQQQFLQHHDSYGQGSAMYTETSAGGNNAAVFPDAQTMNSSVYDSSNGNQNHSPQNCMQAVPGVAGGDSQYYHNGQSAQYQVAAPADPDKQYQHNLQSQFSSTENGAGQFQNQDQSSTSGFKPSSVLPPPFPSSATSSLQYNSSQGNLDFGMMDVNQSSLNNMESEADQFKSPEKMHVDEPEAVYHQTNNSASIGQYQQVFQSQSSGMDNRSSSGAHVQTFSPEGYHQQSSLGSAQQNSSVSNYGISDNGFEQPLANAAASLSSSEFAAPGSSHSSAPQTPASFDMTQNPYPQSSAPSPYSSQNLQHNTAVPQPSPQASASSEFLQSPSQSKPASMEPSDYTSPQSQVVSPSGGVGFSASSSACPAQSNYGSSQPSPYQNSQFQTLSTPNLGHASPGVPDSFQKSPAITNTPTPSPGFSQHHQRHHLNNVDAVQYQQSPQSSHQPSPADNQFQQSPLATSAYDSDATIIHSPDQQSVGYQSKVASPVNSAVPFSPSTPSGNLQQHAYVNNSVPQSSASVSDTSPFMGYSSNDVSLHPADMNTGANGCNSQALSNYGVPTSVNQGQELNDPRKTTSDVAMGGFNANNTLSPPTHPGFGEESDSFSQFDLEAVVNSFTSETNTPSMPDNSSSMSTTSDAAGYNGYQYSNASASFAGTSHTVTDVNSQAGLQYTYNQQNQSGLSVVSSESYLATPPASSFASDTPAQNDTHFGSSSYDLPPSSQASSEAYPQPMQVQDSDFPQKLADPVSSYTYTSSGNNTETAMDISSGLAEKTDALPSGISYEEIHMSIVKAGDALSKNTNEAKQIDQRAVFNTPIAQSGDMNLNTAGIDSGLPQTGYSSQASGFLQTDKSQSSVPVSYSAVSQAPVMTSSNTNPASNINSGIAFVSSSNAPGSISSIGIDHSIISSLLNSIQATSSPSGQVVLQDQLSKQTPVTVPNFLENPAVVSCIRSSNPDNVSLVPSAKIMPGQPQTRFVVTMIAASPANSRPVVASSGMNQPKVAVIASAGIATSQQQVLCPVAPPVTSVPTNPQILNSVVNMPLTSSMVTTSVLGQPSLGVMNMNTVNQPNGIPVGQAVGNSTSGSLAAPGVFLQVAPQQADASGLVLSNASTTAAKPIAKGPKPSLSGLTTVVIPAGSSSSEFSSAPSSQPHIIMSLEDLQKLLAQQNLSQSAQPIQSAPQQPQQTALSSPQTLVLQKPSPLPQRQTQPKLLIKGAGMPNPPRLMHPHQQLHQTREKLQLLVHQTPQSHSVPGGFPQVRSQEQTIITSGQESQQNTQAAFQLVAIQQEQQQQKLQMLEQTQVVDQQQQQPQPKMQLQLKQTQVLQQHQQQQIVQNLFIQQPASNSSDQKLSSLQILGQQPQQLVFPQSHQAQSQADQKPAFVQLEPQLQQQLQQAHSVIQLAQMQLELQQLQKQQELKQEQEQQQLKQLHIQPQLQAQPSEKPDRPERQCSDSLKRDYKHLHSLLTGESTSASSTTAAGIQAKTLPSALSFPSSLNGQSNLQLSSGTSQNSTTASGNSAKTFSPITQASAAPFSFLSQSSSPSSTFSTPGLTFGGFAAIGNNSSAPAATSGTISNHISSAPLSTLAFTKTFSTSAISKSFDSAKDLKTEASTAAIASVHSQSQNSLRLENGPTDKSDMDTGIDQSSNPQASILAQILTESKRSQTPLSVDLSSPANSNSEAPSPLSSPNPLEDGNTQLTLIERSADLHIKSDTMQGVDDDDENASFFDLNTFHKRPSADESQSPEKHDSVPMKIAKPSLDADARSSVRPSSPPDHTFDIGSVVSTASNFSFSFGNGEENGSEVFTFGSSSSATSTTDTLPSTSKPTTKATMMRTAVPTQSVRPTSRKQKEYSLKAYYPSKLDSMELKILEQPEPQHRARYQTEGSRGAIKDVSQQGFPVIKLFGYSKATKLQVFIGDECGRVKPHGFYQACRVFGKNSTACVEQEIEGTAVIEIEMLPENDMTVKLDCIGILKLRNADVERRIGPKRARDKKKTNTRARLVLRCLVDKHDGSQHVLQVVSNPIVCTQPVGQPEISRMSLAECSVEGGESLFIIGKNFKNKGTSVLFQKVDASDDTVLWQAEAEIEQEFFQPTHLICKIPPYKDKVVEKPQLAQIVVSCAGKKSDPQNFTYKPVYPVAPSIKQEVPMETDGAPTSRPLPFVSPEALQLNRMVHETHAQSSTSSTMFQLPPGTLPALQTSTVKTPPTAAPSPLIKPAKLFGLPTTQTAVAAVSPATAASPLPTAMVGALSSGSSPLASSQAGTTLPTFLLEERADGLVPKSQSDSSSSTSRLSEMAPASMGEGAAVSCIVHSNSDTLPVGQTSYTISGNHPQPCLTTSASAGHSLQADTPSNHTSASLPLPAKPFFVVVDPSALQSSVGADKIQQLLQQILEAQSKV